MLRLEDVTIHTDRPLLTRTSFSVPDGAYAVLMGPTGCGKTSLLETICGLRRMSGGRVYLGTDDITNAPVSQRRIGYVPQDGVVFPLMTVRENLAFPLVVRGERSAAIRTETEALAARLGIERLLNRQAGGLSGGEAQRTALGRALASRPRLLLLDEPLSALDPDTHAEMTQLLKAVQAETGVTTLHVTHNQREAVLVGELRLSITGGEVRPQCALPDAERPVANGAAAQ